MLELTTLTNTQRQQFTDYDNLFDHLTGIENLKMVEDHPDFKEMNWSFVVYSPQRVSTLYTHTKNQPIEFKEAFEQNLPLIEICTGDFKNPIYIPQTPDLNMEILKKKWCLKYCASHGITVMENGGDMLEGSMQGRGPACQ